MFVKVKVTKGHSANNNRYEIGDEYFIRRQSAKILQALGKVSIIAGSETVSPSISPKNVQKVVQANIAENEELNDNTELNGSNKNESTSESDNTEEQPQAEFEVVKPKKAGRQSKYASVK